MDAKPLRGLLNKFLKNTVQKSPTDNRLVVFDFSASGITVLYLEMEAAGLKIKNFFQTPETSVTDEERLKNAANYVDALGLKDKPRVTVNWSDGMTFRQLVLPFLPAEDVKQALSWDLKKKYFFNPEENLMGFQEVMTLVGNESAEKLFSVFYCVKKTADARLQWIESLGFEVQGLIPWQSALARFLGTLSHDVEHDLAVCDLSNAAARILVVRQEKVMFSRQVPLETTSLPLPDEILEKIAEEIRKSVEFYESQKYSKPVLKIVFAGAIYDAAHLEEFMAKRLEMKFSFPNVLPFASSSLLQEQKKIIADRAGVFAPALGAALVREESLNLVPEEIRRKNKQKKNEKLLQLAFLAVAAVMAFTLLFMWGRVGVVGAQLRSTDKEWAVTQSYKKLFDFVAFREKMRRSGLKNDVAHGALLKELGRLTPAQVMLQQTQFSRKEGNLVIVGEVHGAGKDQVKVATKYVDNLNQSPFFKNVTLATTTQENKDQNFHFEIHCLVKGIS